jgi:hypothetical protein
MNELQRRLLAFFGELGLPVFLRGWVPAGQPRPYLTLELELAPLREPGTLVLRYYAPAVGGNRLRLDWLAALGERIPPAGVSVAGQAVIRPGKTRLSGCPGDRDGLAAEAELGIVRFV